MGNVPDVDGEARAPGAVAPATLEEVADGIRQGRYHRIVVLLGRGASAAAGIPDHRQPGNYIYDQMRQYGLPSADALFDLEYFRKRPFPFFFLAKELWPGKYRPTDVHLFVRLLADQGLLLRVYTQNIDGLERLAGLPPALLVECHGSFQGAHTIDDPILEMPIAEFRSALFSLELVVRHPETKSLVKPDIVFFGEAVPDRVFDCAAQDLPACDLLLVIGTSLSEVPFGALPRLVRPDVSRVLINRRLVGDFEAGVARSARDVLALGDANATIVNLVALLGWDAALQQLKATVFSSPGEMPQ